MPDEANVNEKKEPVQGEAKPAEDAPRPAPEAPKPAPEVPKSTPEAVNAAVPPKVAEAAKEPAAKKERPANCEACNKPIKVKWYYRNGRYYCTKQCFKAEQKKKKVATPAS